MYSNRKIKGGRKQYSMVILVIENLIFIQENVLKNFIL